MQGMEPGTDQGLAVDIRIKLHVGHLACTLFPAQCIEQFKSVMHGCCPKLLNTMKVFVMSKDARDVL